MSTDFNYDDFQPFYEGHKPRPYHFFKVILCIQNKYTFETISKPFYLSSKFSLKWLAKIIEKSHIRYPREVLDVTLKFYEVEDSDHILFQHITSEESFEREATIALFNAVLLYHWKLSPRELIKKYFKKFRTFLKSRIFIHRKPEIITL